jgi:uncharacterized protein YjbJ (UPF0337 family)
MAMSHTREKAEGFTKQVIGQMIGDDLLVQEGKAQERKAKEEDKREDKSEDITEQGQPSQEEQFGQPPSRQGNDNG